jgi:HEAT repeat protein
MIKICAEDSRGTVSTSTPYKAPGWFWLGSLVLLAATAGCAQSPGGWHPKLAGFTTPVVDAGISTASLAGRVARIEAIAIRASSLSESEAANQVRSLSGTLGADSAAPEKVAAVRCLGKLPSPTAVEALGLALRDSDAEVRTEACRALAGIDSPHALSLLTETVAQDANVDAKLAAVRGLSKFRDPRAVQALGAALEDPDPAVQFAAMQSLESCTGEDLGQDVRRWREFARRSPEVLARRDRHSGRL